MKRKYPPPTVIKSGRWYAAGHGPPLLEECCDCGLVHTQEFRFELKNGKILVWVRWTVNDKETRTARKRPQRYVRRKAKRVTRNWRRTRARGWA